MRLPPRSSRQAGRTRTSRVRLALLLAASTLLATSLTAMSLPSPSVAQPVGLGPVPIDFDLTDNQGSWFDTDVSLFGGQSLGVAVQPRVGLSTLTSTVQGLLNTDLTGITNLSLAGGSPTVGSLPVGTDQLLNLPELKSAVSGTSLLSFLDPKANEANSLIDQLGLEMATKPVTDLVPMDQLPVGADLMDLLGDLQNTSQSLTVDPTVNFHVKAPDAATVHSVTSLIWPTGAKGFPFDQSSAFIGDQSITLTQPGLYAFACKIHPYMLGAVVVDDPLTPGLDFGKSLDVNVRGGITVPSDADIISELVQKFFRITVPSNWQHYSATDSTTWDPHYPPVPILVYDKDKKPELIPNLDAYFQKKFDEPKVLKPANQKPATPGVGEVWVDTQMEKTAGKTKSGTATKVDVENWSVARKVALPGINLNNPHNMWTDRDAKYIYQTEWFSDRLTVFDRRTGAYIRSIQVGPAPSHVMTRTDTDQLHVAINGGNSVVELSPGATKIDRRIPVQGPGEKPAHPHAHWMSADGKTMVTPNPNTNDSTIVNVPDGTIRKAHTDELPIATGMMPDTSKYYVANFLGQDITCISLADAACNDGSSKVGSKTIDLWKNYDPVSGAVKGDWGGLPIQIPVSPDGKAVLVANTLTGTITVINPATDEIVKTLPCDSGCHGINFGAKKGGGYYAYVSSKFSNAMSVVDPDPNGDGDPMDAAVVGRMLLEPTAATAMDDTVVKYAGMGGQGVLPIPIVYNGWSQHVPPEFADRLTCRQRDPLSSDESCK